MIFSHTIYFSLYTHNLTLLVSVISFILTLGLTTSNAELSSSTNESSGYIPELVTIYETSKKGKKLTPLDDSPAITKSAPDGAVTISINLNPSSYRQTITGIGGALTESSAIVLNKLPLKKRNEIMEAFFSPKGNHYSLARIHIASCDFSEPGKYTYAMKEDLSDFTIKKDTEEEYDVVPMIKQALELAGDDHLKLLASPWTAPPWMKEIEGEKDADVIKKYTDSDGYFGGVLKKEHYPTFADYIVAYLDAYKNEGIDIWGLTPVNEPYGNGANWESMHFEGDQEGEYVHDALVPALEKAGYGGIEIYGFDQNKGDHAKQFVKGMEDQSDKGDFDGIGLHWYWSTWNTYIDELEFFHTEYPHLKLLATEATIDQLRGDSPGEGIGFDDPDKCGDNCQASDAHPNNMENPWFERSDWWKWWWERNHGSWGYDDGEGYNYLREGLGIDPYYHQPAVEGVYRYGRDIISSLNHWVTGWIDWNIVLDDQGGPNHVGNWCAAPVMVKGSGSDAVIHYNPTFYLFGHFSKFIRPGATVLEVSTEGNDSEMDTDKKSTFEGVTREVNISGEEKLEVTAALNSDGSIAVVILNDEESTSEYSITLGEYSFTGTIEGHAIQTVVIEEAAMQSSSSIIISSSSSLSSSIESSSSMELSSSALSSSSMPYTDTLTIGVTEVDTQLAANTSMQTGSHAVISIQEPGEYTISLFNVSGELLGTFYENTEFVGTKTIDISHLETNGRAYIVQINRVR
ncbi:MAG: hypothetical protein OCC49_01220 [Fibrobacterales bacterium]